MALATRCPHCHTTFRVAHDQLKLRAGLVRCGACKQIFNGIENLVPAEDLQPAPPKPANGLPAAGSPVATFPPRSLHASVTHPMPSPAPNAGANNSRLMSFPDRPGAGPSDQTASGVGAPGPVTPDETITNDPLLRMTLLDFAPLKRRSAEEADLSASTTPPADTPDPIATAIADLQRSVPQKSAGDVRASPSGRIEPGMDDASPALHEEENAAHTEYSYEEPRFMRQGRRRQRVSRKLRAAMFAGAIILTVTLLAQTLLINRNHLSASYPQMRPLLAGLCASLGCRIQLPAQIEAVSIESSELQGLNPDENAFLLTILLRNRSATAQTWPNLELTLTDESDKPVARRVFTAHDYLPASSNIERGLGPRSEQTVKIHFQLTQHKAAGYRVYLFYP